MNGAQLLEQKSMVDFYLDQGPRPISSFSFVSLFAWCDFFDFDFKIINDSLCILACHDFGKFLYLPPLGNELNASTIDLAFEAMAQGKPIKPVNRIENIPGNLLSAFPEGSYNQYLKPAEYLYRKADLIALKGNAYKSKRHDCNFFAAHHGVRSLEVYVDGDFEACMELYERWAEDRAKTNSDDIYRSMLQENRQVHARLLKFWQLLGLVVRVLKVDGRIIGYTFGYALEEHTFCVYAEIADLSVTGTAAYMFKHFCADFSLSKFSYINTMDDFAMPKVARAKKAYHPSALIPSYTVSIKAAR